jgi:hypothetical protein
LDRNEWGIFKRRYQLSKSSIFNRADVGPHIEEFQTALAAYKQSHSGKDLLRAHKRLEALRRAFDKFIELKQGKLELTTEAKDKIDEWKKQLDAVEKDLATQCIKHPDKLKQADCKQMDGTLKKMFPSY